MQGPIYIRTEQNFSASPQINDSETPSVDDESLDTPAISHPFRDTGRLVFWTSHASLVTRSSGHDSVNIVINGKDTACEPNGQWEERVPGILDYVVISRGFDDSRKVESLTLLMVEWSKTELNVASRIGTCEIGQEDWVLANPVYNLIILE